MKNNWLTENSKNYDFLLNKTTKVYPFDYSTKENLEKSTETNVKVFIINNTTERPKDLNENDENESVPYYYGFLGLVGLIVGSALSSVIVLIPKIGGIDQPSHWYRYSILYSIGVGFGLSINFGLVQPSYWMGLNFFQSWKPFVSRFFIVSVSLFVSNASCYAIWTSWLEQNYPMPLNYFLCNTISFSIMQATLWIYIPKSDEQRRVALYWKFWLSQVIIVFCFWEYLGMGLALTNIPIDYQWVLAIVFALIREINQGILARVCCRISGRNRDLVKISAWHWMAAVNAFFLTVAMSSVATAITSYMILAIDFFMNVLLCIQVIWKFKKNKSVLNDEIMLDLNELVLNEKLETVIPLGYCLCYLMAYYGPNKDILGNIKESDVEKTMKVTALLFFLDVSSLFVSSLLLWFICKINLFKVYIRSQKELWWIMASQEAYLLYEVKIVLLLLFHC